MEFSPDEIGIGHNSLGEHGLDEANLALLHSIYDELLGVYTEPVDPGSHRAHERLVTQRNAAMKALVRLTRRSKNFDCKAAIMVVVAALSDNQYGRATISNPRLGRVLKRDPSTIEKAISELVSEGYLGRESQPGRASSTWVITTLVDAQLKPNDIINKIDPKGQRRAQKAPAWDAGAVADTTRVGRGGYQPAPPYSDAGGSSHAPRTEQAYPPHHLSEPPARGVAQPYENTGEAGANTAIYNTTRKNTPFSLGHDAGELESWIELFRPTEAVTASDAQFGSGDEFRQLSHQESISLARALVFGLKREGGELAMTVLDGPCHPAECHPRHTRLAVEMMGLPHCTVQDAIDATALAGIELQAALAELDALATTLKKLPSGGVISSNSSLQSCFGSRVEPNMRSDFELGENAR